MKPLNDLDEQLKNEESTKLNYITPAIQKKWNTEGDRIVMEYGNEDRSIVAECKCYTWTDSGNVPSAKLMGLDEAVFYLGFLPVGTKKILCMKRATFQGKAETLAEYYVRVHGHLLGDVFVYEISDDGTMKKIRNGLTE